tara:strand:+ start:6643 stop:7257 length:615 start_codon:yes stop_codon:yes gene_type:complete
MNIKNEEDNKRDEMKSGYDSDYKLILSNIEKNDLDKAEKLAKKFALTWPAVPNGWSALAYIYFIKKDYKKSIEYNEKLLTIDHIAPKVYLNIAHCYHYLENHEKILHTLASSFFDCVLVIGEKMESLYNLMSYLLSYHYPEDGITFSEKMENSKNQDFLSKIESLRHIYQDIEVSSLIKKIKNNPEEDKTSKDLINVIRTLTQE